MTGYYVVFESAGNVSLKEFEVPQVQPDEVLLESDYSIISAGTELANLANLPNTVASNKGFPFFPGYSASGRVVDAGRDVANLKVGDRVVIAWGGHRSHTVMKAQSVLKIEDESTDMLDASLAHIASFALLGVRKLRIELGESAMVAGMGILGALAVQFAGLSGAVPVLAADMDPVRRDLALRLGAAAAFSPDEEDFVGKVRAASGGGGPNAVVEVTGSATALRQALEYVAWAGRVSLLGCTRVSDAPIDFYKHVHCRGVSLIGANTFARPRMESSPGGWTELDDYRTYLKLLSAGKIQTRPLISEIVRPSDARAVYERLAASANPPLGVAFDWKKI